MSNMVNTWTWRKIRPLCLESRRITMQFVTFINYVSSNTIMSTNWSILLNHLPRKPILLYGNIFGYQGWWVWSHRTYKNFSLAFFLNKWKHFVDWGEWIHQDDLTSDVWERLIESHYIFKNILLIKKYMNRFQATTRTRRNTSTWRKGFIVTKFITKTFETSKV